MKLKIIACLLLLFVVKSFKNSFLSSNKRLKTYNSIHSENLKVFAKKSNQEPIIQENDNNGKGNSSIINLNSLLISN